MSDVLPDPQVYLYPKPIGPLLNRLDQFFVGHVVGAAGLVFRGD